MTLLSVENVKKSFGGTQVLFGVDFTLRSGETHALVGANGAGKSTLIKIISGVLRPDSGAMLLSGSPVSFPTPADANRAGIDAVYQEAVLCPDLTVLENMFLGRELVSPLGLVKHRRQRELAAAALARLDLAPDIMDTPARSISVAMKQLVLIARAFLQKTKVVIFDEPTATITFQESQRLFDAINQLRADGVGIIYISHRMEEIFSLADRITVMRDGKVIDTVAPKDSSTADLVKLMTGKDVTYTFTPRDVAAEPPVLEVKGLAKAGLFRDVSFSLRRREVLGLFGLVGSGASELLQTLFGVHVPDAGAVLAHGNSHRPHSPGEARLSDLGYLPDDRKTEAIFADMSVKENLSLNILPSLSLGGVFIRTGREKDLASDSIRRLLIKTRDMDAPIKSLSGGNQQKVILSRWLALNPSLLFLNEPTRGVDVGAKGEIHQLIRDLAGQGTALIIVSSELSEILQTCDSIAVMHRGSFMGPFPGKEMDGQRLLRLALGEEEHAHARN